MSVTMSQADRATFLEQVAANPTPRHLDEVAAEHGMFLAEAKELVQRHGWPRGESLHKAADILRRGGNPGVGLVVVPKPPPVQTPPPREEDTESYEQLLETARGHDVKRIANLGRKIGDELDLLRDLIAADRHDAKARAEVARLKRELAEAQARLTGKPATAAASCNGVDPKTVRAWAAEQGVVCSKAGRVPAAVVAAYQEAHA